MFGSKDAPKASGMEIMLKSMGMGEVIEAAKALANAGTLEKILKFADEVEGINEKLAIILDKLDRLEGGGRVVERAGKVGEQHGDEFAAGSGAANGGPVQPAADGLATGTG